MKLKQEYTSIPVPPEAKQAIAKGISKAEQERRKKSMKTTILKKSGICAAAAVLCLGIGVNASPTVANAMQPIPIIGSIAKVLTLRTYTDTQQTHMAQVDIPQIDGSAPVNAQLKTYAENLIAQYEQEVAQMHPEGHYALESSYKVISDHTDYVSIQINTVVTQASGAEFVKVFTVDKQTGEAVSLLTFLNNDTDALEKISQNIRSQMTQQMQEDENVIYFAEGEPGGFTGLTGNENFYIDDNGDLVIVFGEYEVAPGYMGTVSFTIPMSIVQK